MNKSLDLLEQFEREFNAMPQEVFDAMGTDLRERWLALIVNAKQAILGALGDKEQK